MTLPEYLAQQQKRVDVALDRWVPAESQDPSVIHRAMRYSLFAGGKRIRPLLAMAAAEAVSDHAAGIESAACALELIHTYSLIHDDLPALDNDDLRRGRPTCHKVFGDAMAILAGDALLTLAFEVLSKLPNVDAERRIRLVAELDAGPVFGVLTEPVGAADTAGELLGRLAVSGADLLVATLDGIESGELEARPQPHDGVSYAPKLDRAVARVNWKLPAQPIDRLIRACTPAPGAWTTLNGATVKLGPVGLAGVAAADWPDLSPGEVRVTGSAVLVGTGTRPVRLGEVQLEGKRRMPSMDWARGVRGAGLVLD